MERQNNLADRVSRKLENRAIDHLTNAERSRFDERWETLKAPSMRLITEPRRIGPRVEDISKKLIKIRDLIFKSIEAIEGGSEEELRFDFYVLDRDIDDIIGASHDPVGHGSIVESFQPGCTEKACECLVRFYYRLQAVAVQCSCSITDDCSDGYISDNQSPTNVLDTNVSDQYPSPFKELFHLCKLIQYLVFEMLYPPTPSTPILRPVSPDLVLNEERPARRVLPNGRHPLPSHRPRRRTRSVSPFILDEDSGNCSPLPPRRESATRRLQLHPAPGSKTRTNFERLRGERLKDDSIGRKADNPCKNCRKDPGRCRVPIDPEKFNSFKCGHCIGIKLGCSFDINTPGIDYPPETIARMREADQRKQAGRQKAKETRRKNKEANRKEKETQ